MSEGHQGQRHPADAVGCAVQVAKIATDKDSEAMEKPRPIRLFYEKAAPYFNIKRKHNDRDSIGNEK